MVDRLGFAQSSRHIAWQPRTVSVGRRVLSLSAALPGAVLGFGSRTSGSCIQLLCNPSSYSLRIPPLKKPPHAKFLPITSNHVNRMKKMPPLRPCAVMIGAVCLKLFPALARQMANSINNRTMTAEYEEQPHFDSTYAAFMFRASVGQQML